MKLNVAEFRAVRSLSMLSLTVHCPFFVGINQPPAVKARSSNLESTCVQTAGTEAATPSRLGKHPGRLGWGSKANGASFMHRNQCAAKMLATDANENPISVEFGDDKNSSIFV
jgi:hypothetical protein